jgi:hypothetical protein
MAGVEPFVTPVIRPPHGKSALFILVWIRSIQAQLKIQEEGVMQAAMLELLALDRGDGVKLGKYTVQSYTRSRWQYPDEIEELRAQLKTAEEAAQLDGSAIPTYATHLRVRG